MFVVKYLSDLQFYAPEFDLLVRLWYYYSYKIQFSRFWDIEA